MNRKKRECSTDVDLLQGRKTPGSKDWWLGPGRVSRTLESCLKNPEKDRLCRRRRKFLDEVVVLSCACDKEVRFALLCSALHCSGASEGKGTLRKY